MSDQEHDAWHAMPVAAAVRALGADVQRGLTHAEANARRARFGPNELREAKRRGPLRIFVDQFAELMILVLLAAALIAGVIGEPKDAAAIVAIVLLNAVIGFIQEFRAERAMRALKALAAATGSVRRDGERVVIPAAEIVPGDVVVLEAGNIVPADLRLVESAQLRIDESILTGESVPVDKHTAAITGAAEALGDRVNLAFKGTVVTYGRGVGVTVATGMQTALGHIATLLERGEETRTPLQRRLAVLGRRLGYAVMVLCAVLFAMGALRGEPLMLMLLTAISLAVAAIPEALPAVVTISLALGASRMARGNALVRRLPAVETLGSVSFICSDKTGTLTRNLMQVTELFVANRSIRDWRALDSADPKLALLQAIALNSDVVLNQSGTVIGDPTEVALVHAADAAGLDVRSLQATQPRALEIPFDSNRKRMTTFHARDGHYLAYTKGAPERVVARCELVLTERGAVPIDRAAVLAVAERMAGAGLRVIAVARRAWPTLPHVDALADAEQELVLLGLVGMIDPPRPEAAAAVAQCRSAGITPVMITGDHPATAGAIARQLGILGARGQVITGAELTAMDDAALRERVAHIRVYARVDPEQKIRIVLALQARGELVAMTGDGVNDAPALRCADIGVSMGRGGTDVAREASGIVLLDDNFATIVAAVREGRRIYDNIRKFVRFAMSGNAGEIWLLAAAPLFGLPIPLLPIHILWVNLVTDGLPGLALALEPTERDVMDRAPRPAAESIFAHGMWQHIVWVGLLIGGLSLGVQAYGINTGSAHWQTMTFTVITFAQMFHVLAIRSERESLLTQGILSNMPLAGAVALTFVLQLATIYLPSLNAVFNTAPLDLGELLLCVALSSTVLVAVEVEKVLVRARWIYRS